MTPPQVKGDQKNSHSSTTQYASFAEHGYGRNGGANPRSRCLSGSSASLAFISPVTLGYPLRWLIARKPTRMAALVCLLLYALVTSAVFG